uniref:Uncharacterized protein n=1 Tax=Euplotes harpa TaxID=151035 RepID=A0A7S3J6T5_9SPIT|mmetsp:Transcript_18520/g.21272  ORF Transcript_18520/g.21272 Transcript_18520/m.21272 type:complete len:206 (+) Transcript_18520:1-618(+)
MVTAYDVMFGKSKGHEVIELSKAVSHIRENLDKATKTGILKTDNTEGVLIDIRQALNQCDQSKNQVLKEAEKSIKDLIKALYERKDVLIENINNYFLNERKKIEEQEQVWREKQKITDDLLKLSSNRDDDHSLLENSKYIADGIQTLSEKTKFNHFEMINSLDTTMHVIDDETNVKKADIPHEELKRLISQYIAPSEKKKIQYRC